MAQCFETPGRRFNLTERGAVLGFSAIQSAWALEALRHYDFSSVGTWCDVGGGHGHMMCAFLAAYPHLSGTVHMMCWGSGQERTKEEYASLLEASGWRFVACHYPSHASMGVVEGMAQKRAKPSPTFGLAAPIRRHDHQVTPVVRLGRAGHRVAQRAKRVDDRRAGRGLVIRDNTERERDE
jgi:hypothetical protein